MSLSPQKPEGLMKKHNQQALKLVTHRKMVQSELAEVLSQLEQKMIETGMLPPKRKVKNDKSLRTKVFEILEEHPDGITADDVTSQVIAMGHQTTSQDLRTQVLRILSASLKVVRHDKEKVYQLISK